MFAILRDNGIECGMCRLLHDTWTDAWICCTGFVLYDNSGEFVIVAATEFPDDSPITQARRRRLASLPASLPLWECGLSKNERDC